MNKKNVLSEMQITLDVIGGKWKPLILHFLEKNGEQYYSDILRYLETVSKKALTTSLKELEKDNIIKRTVIPTTPIRVKYSVTNHGRSLYPLLDIMCSWGYINQKNYNITHSTCKFSAETKLQKSSGYIGYMKCLMKII